MSPSALKTEPCHILVSEQLDASTRGRLVREVLRALRGGHGAIVLDFSRCVRVDSIAVHALARVARRCEVRGGALVLENLRQYISARAAELRGLANER